MPLSNEEVLRYSRHIILPEVGGRGQLKLKASRVLLAGLGPTGSVAALYLAAAGIGAFALYDPDLASGAEDFSRWTGEEGARAELAAAKMTAINPDASVNVVAHPDLSAVDVVLVTSGDPLQFRSANVPVVVAGTAGMSGSATVLIPGALAPEGITTDASDAFLPAAGVVGSIAATEVVKLILGAGRILSGRVLRYDGLSASFRE